MLVRDIKNYVKMQESLKTKTVRLLNYKQQI